MQKMKKNSTLKKNIVFAKTISGDMVFDGMSLEGGK
jgi:hypothetical protein